jgi:hypothetical protein
MKRLNNFLDKAPLWQVYIFGWFFAGSLFASLFYGLQLIGATSPELLITGINCIKIGAITGILFGLMIMLMVSMMRKSQKFWDYAKVVEELIDKEETQTGLNSIFNNEFQSLRKLSQGGPHIHELNKQYQTMKIKYKYVK